MESSNSNNSSSACGAAGEAQAKTKRINGIKFKAGYRVDAQDYLADWCDCVCVCVRLFV
tara:strand:+ start:152 stop:328 length:177 start_codon:yes stop_codon:yes gene_type:complete